jgi:hypothetical protein
VVLPRGPRRQSGHGCLIAFSRQPRAWVPHATPDASDRSRLAAAAGAPIGLGRAQAPALPPAARRRSPGLGPALVSEGSGTIPSQRLLRAFARRGLLPGDDVQAMRQWEHGGGLSVDRSVCVAATDRAGPRRLPHYCARPPFALDRLRDLDPERLGYRPPKPGPGGIAPQCLTPLELLERLAVLAPPPAHPPPSPLRRARPKLTAAQCGRRAAPPCPGAVARPHLGSLSACVPALRRYGSLTRHSRVSACVAAWWSSSAR